MDIHRAIGVKHDLPTPGNLLSGALSICMDITICMIANRMGITFESLRVKVAAYVDVRETLRVAEEVPVELELHYNIGG